MRPIVIQARKKKPADEPPPARTPVIKPRPVAPLGEASLTPTDTAPPPALMVAAPMPEFPTVDPNQSPDVMTPPPMAARVPVIRPRSVAAPLSDIGQAPHLAEEAQAGLDYNKAARMPIIKSRWKSALLGAAQAAAGAFRNGPARDINELMYGVGAAAGGAAGGVVNDSYYGQQQRQSAMAEAAGRQERAIKIRALSSQADQRDAQADYTRQHAPIERAKRGCATRQRPQEHHRGVALPRRV